jgi:hypothetical protein
MKKIGKICLLFESVKPISLRTLAQLNVKGNHWKSIIILRLEIRLNCQTKKMKITNDR